MRTLRDLVLASLLLTTAGLVAADPATIAFSLISAGVSGSVAVFIGNFLLPGLLLGVSMYQTSAARRKQKAAAARQRAEYNAGLSDRFATVISTEAPQQVIYGETYVGGAIVAIFQSNRSPDSATRSFGIEGKNQDALKHLVVVLAAHECEEISQIKIDGTVIGPLDGSGFVTSGEFASSRTVSYSTQHVVGAGGFINLPRTPSAVRLVGWFPGGDQDVQYPTILGVSGSVVQIPVGFVGLTVGVTYDAIEYMSTVRVQKHLGVPGEAADAYLMAAVPSRWTADHKLSGYCYLVVTLDLNERRFQGGPPQIQALVRGKKIYDPRTDTTAWSQNPALCIADYLQSPMWQGSSAVSVTEADVIAAANACDESIPNPLFGVEAGAPAEVPRFTCNGAFTTDLGSEAVLEDLAESMAGYAFVGGGWRILAGVWSTPVATLDADNADGDIEIVQVGSKWSEVFNSVRGNYVQLAATATEDFPPYSNNALVEADGQELWEDVSFPFTNRAWRCTNLARIRVEKSRNGLTLRWPASMEHWGLTPGDRVWVNHPSYGFVNKTFKVTEWAFSLNSPVVLTLQEDAAAVYDPHDQIVLDQTPNTALPNPFLIPSVAGLGAESGTSQLLVTADGTVQASIMVSWTRDESMPASSTVVLQHRPISAPDGEQVQTVRLPGDQASARISGYAEGEAVHIRVRYENLLAEGDWSTLAHVVVGKSEPPSNVPSASVEYDPIAQGLTLRWGAVADPDIDFYEVRSADSGWGGPGALFRGNALSTPVAPSSGAWYVRARDTTGHYSVVSTATSYAFPTVPQVSAVSHLFADTSLTTATVTISWVDAAPPFGLGAYRISHSGGSVTTRSNSVTLPADWLGDRLYSIATLDRYGNESAAVLYSVTKLAPLPVSNFRAQVIDNTVLLYWTLPARTSLPIAHVHLRRGADWEGAEEIGTKDGEFTSLAELTSGEYTYWIAVVDTDGNESTPISLTTFVSQPPDFIFNAEYVWDRTGTLNNAALSGPGVLMPVNTTETWAQHFVNNGWSTPAAQISAGYPVYAQPGLTSGYYEQIFDYGTVLASSSVTVTVAGNVAAGSPVTQVITSISLDGSSWTDYPGLTNVFALNFRYVKVRVSATQAAAGDLFELTQMSVRLDSRLKTDAGSVSAVSTDASGTVVNFNTDFVDVVSIAPAALGVAARYAVADFLDEVKSGTYSVVSNVATINTTAHGLLPGQRVRLMPSTGSLPLDTYTVASVVNANSYTVSVTHPNTSGALLTYPNSMRVYLYDTSGVRQSGPVSWTIRGS